MPSFIMCANMMLCW